MVCIIFNITNIDVGAIEAKKYQLSVIEPRDKIVL